MKLGTRCIVPPEDTSSVGFLFFDQKDSHVIAVFKEEDQCTIKAQGSYSYPRDGGLILNLQSVNEEAQPCTDIDFQTDWHAPFYKEGFDLFVVFDAYACGGDGVLSVVLSNYM